MRKVISLNEGWRFKKGGAEIPRLLPEDWETVDLPHTWNAVDGHDGRGGYYRGRCLYARTFKAPRQPLGNGRVYVEVLAAGQQAEVYVNGSLCAVHAGGYSAFRADVTELCREEGEDLLVISCSNEHREDVYPQSADFTFYGGLYRGVDLLCVPEAHFDPDFFGGLKVTPRPVPGGAVFKLETLVKNAAPELTVLYSVEDRDRREVAAGTRPSDDGAIELFVPDARLWNVTDPYLYTVRATLQRRNEACDQVEVRAGARSFGVDPERGFILNGVPTPLRGVCRHQDRLYKGNALTREEHFEDARIIKDLGANMVRLAHYQHSQDFYDACDELGLVVWAEIPFISVFSQAPGAHENCVSQLTELITQCYDHPSICFWGISNEILIGGMKEGLVERHRELNDLVKRLDPTRLTTIAQLSSTPADSPLNGITDVIGYNHYMGWYGGQVEDNGPWLDDFHKKRPDLCLGLSEYGCEGIITYHSPEPFCKDYSEEYQALYHEHMARVLDRRPWIWASCLWNMFDFGVAARDEGGVAGRNNKGLVTMDRRTKKDSYYIYRAYWNPEPMVHIAGRRYAQRAGETTVIRVYSSLPEVELFVNGRSAGKLRGDRVFVFTVALRPGSNFLVAEAGGVKDSVTLQRVEREPEVYRLPGAGDLAKYSGNWFEKLDIPTRELSFPPGCCSVRDTFEELSRIPEAFEIIVKYMRLATNFKLEPGQGMWSDIKDLSPQDLSSQGRLPDGFLQVVNPMLNQIQKKA